MEKESLPLILMMAMAPVPGTVAGAQIVSSMLSISVLLRPFDGLRDQSPNLLNNGPPKPSTEATTKDKFINIPQHIQGITDKLVKTHTKLAIFAPQNLLYGSE